MKQNKKDQFRKFRISRRTQKVSDQDSYLTHYSDFVRKDLTEKLNKARGKINFGFDPDHIANLEELTEIGKEIVSSFKNREKEFMQITCPKKEVTISKHEALLLASKILDVIAEHEHSVIYSFGKYINGTYMEEDKKNKKYWKKEEK